MQLVVLVYDCPNIVNASIEGIIDTETLPWENTKSSWTYVYLYLHLPGILNIQ